MLEQHVADNEILNEFVGIANLSLDSHCGQILEEVVIDCLPLIAEFLAEPISVSVTAENFNNYVTVDREQKFRKAAFKLYMALNKKILTNAKLDFNNLD